MTAMMLRDRPFMTRLPRLRGVLSVMNDWLHSFAILSHLLSSRRAIVEILAHLVTREDFWRHQS
jgi:hypothetical protein